VGAPSTLPPAPFEVRLPPFERVVLDNGVVLLLMEQREVPLVSVQVTIRAGGAADPRGKEGLADITAGLLRKGTKTRTAEQLAAELDFLGTRLGGAAGMELSYLAAEFLAKDREEGMRLLADVLLQPVFPEKEVAKQLARMRDAVRQAKEDPAEVIGQYAARFYYGPDHPYGRPIGGDEQSLGRIKRADVVAFHRAHYVPSNALVALVGDLPLAELRDLAQRTFGSWQGPAAPPATIPPPPPFVAGRVLLVDKPDAPQTHFVFLAPGIARTAADRVGVDVVNTLFGGRFSSWLMTKLRVESGLTYGAGSGFVSRSQPGHFRIRSYTETANSAKALDLTLAQLDRLHGEGPSEVELRSVRTYLQGQYPPTVETADQLAGILTEIEYFGLGRAEVDEYLGRVGQVDLAAARRVAAERFPKRDGVGLVLIGKAAVLRELAGRFGTVTEKPLNAPGF
jgi:predicted Zn-dependent peptidase